MTGISSGVGLISGINTGQLIDQLIAIDSQPKILAQSRQAELQNQQASFLGLNSLILTLQSAAANFATNKIFQSKTVTSSDPSVLSATAESNAALGTYQFVVAQRVTTNQVMSRGFADHDTTGLGLSNVTFEFGHGKLTSSTRLIDLNGGDGVARGKIKITDSNGDASTIDLSEAVTVNDVLDAINNETGIEVTASVNSDGSGLMITDNAGGAGKLEIENQTGYTTATDLGIAQSDDDLDGVITGSAIDTVSFDRSLATLNDGNGVRINNGLDLTDFKMQTRDGSSYDIKLGERTNGDSTDPAVTTLQGVKDRIEEITGGNVTVALSADGRSISLTDHTVGAGTFQTLAGTAGATEAAEDLGIFKAADPGTPDTIAGDALIAGINSVLTKSLNGGAGLSGASTLTITDRAGNSDAFTIDPNSSVSDIINQINNSATLNVTASMNRAGNGLAITDTVGGASNLIIQGDAAAVLGLDTGPTGVAANAYNGSNVQLQYVSDATSLSSLNYARGVGEGSFRITDAEGNSATVDIDDDSKTLGDVIDEINSKGLAITARVNDHGDGLLIENTSAAPATAIRVESVSGTTAKDLNILGTAADATDNNFIDGSYEQKITLDPTDTLDDLISKINSDGISAQATLIDNGTGVNPNYISMTSKFSGSAGDMSIDTGNVDFAFNTLSKAQDAVAFFGAADPAQGILVTSTTNTLSSVISGVTVNLNGTSSEPVEVSVGEDTQTVVDNVNSFITAFNAVVDRLNSLDNYNPDTQEKSVLLGNPTIARIRSQMYRTIQGTPQGVSTQYQYLSQVGVTVGDNGDLVLDEAKFRDALADDPDAVSNLFAAKHLASDQNIDLGGGVTSPSEKPIYDQLGVAEQISTLATQLTDSVDGTLTLVNENYDTQIQSIQDQIDQYDVQLAAKRTFYQNQFNAMEQTLAALQSQQRALSSLAAPTG